MSDRDERDVADANDRSDDTGVDVAPDDVSAAEPNWSGSPMAGREERPHLSAVERQGSPYTESQVIMPTVKAVAPFALTYGLFVTFHGGGSPGGGFQGGAIMAAVVFMIAFAFGIDSTREWLANSVVVGLAVGGTLIFAGIGLATMALGGAFLQYDLLPIPKPVTYGMEGVEVLGIAAIVSGVLMGLFFLLASGFAREEPAVTDGGRATDDAGGAGGRATDDAGGAGGRATDDAGGAGGRATDDAATDGGDK